MTTIRPLHGYRRSILDLLPDPVPLDDLPEARAEHLVHLSEFLPDAKDATIDLAPLEAVVRATLEHEVHARASTDAERNALDGWLAPRVHAAVRVSRRIASNEAFWRWLALEVAAPIVALRFGSREGVPRWRLVGGPLRNGLSRLWWGAEMTRDGPDYGLLPHVFARTRTAQFALELSYSQYRTAAVAFTRVAEGLDGGPRLSDAEMKALSTSVNARLSLRVLEAATSPSLDGPRDGAWWRAAPDVGTLVGPSGPTGPDDGYADPGEVEALSRWFRDIASNDGPPPSSEAGGASSTPGESAAVPPDPEGPTSATHDPSHAPSDGYEWTEYGTRYLDRGLPDPWIPVLDRLIAEPVPRLTPERWNPAWIERTLDAAFDRDPRTRELLRDRYVKGATLREIARSRDVTRQRIEQLEKKALRKVAEHDQEEPIEADDDLRARLRGVHARPLVLDATDEAVGAARTYVAWALRGEVTFVDVGAHVVIVGSAMQEVLDRAEEHVVEQSAFQSPDALAADLETSPDAIPALVAISETLYVTRDGRIGSDRWSNVQRMTAVAHALADSELGVTSWHGSEIGAALKRVFPGLFDEWGVRDAFGTLSRPNQDALERTEERGYWRLAKDR